MVHFQVLLCLDTYNTDTIAINKLCKLNFRNFTMDLAMSAAGLSGLFFSIRMMCYQDFGLQFIDLLPV